MVLLLYGKSKQLYYDTLSKMPLPNPFEWCIEWIQNENEVLIDTVMRYKGLESDIVFLWSLDGVITGILDDLIYVDEKNSGLIEVIVLMDEPKLAADIANFISEYVVRYVGEEQKVFARKTKIFLKKRLDSSQNELKISEINLTLFKEKNPLNLDTPELQLERIRLIRKVEVNQEVYITIRLKFNW